MKKLLSTLLLIVFLITQSSLTFAQSNDDTGRGQSSEHAQNINRDDSSNQGSSSAKTPPGRQKACEKKQAVIKKRLDNLTKMATRMLETFNRIAGKVAGSGQQSASGSATLSEGAQAKKKAVEDALAKAKTDAESFSCTSSDPKQALKNFRVNMQSVKRALKEYRTEIKNMIKAKKGERQSSGSGQQNDQGEDEDD